MSDRAADKGECSPGYHASHMEGQLESPEKDFSLIDGESSHNDQLECSGVKCFLASGNNSHHGHFEGFADESSRELRESLSVGQLQYTTNTCSIDCENTLQNGQLENPPITHESSVKGGKHSLNNQLSILAGECLCNLVEDSNVDQVECPTERTLHDEDDGDNVENPTDEWLHNETAQNTQLENAPEESKLECGKSLHASHTSVICVASSQESHLQIPESITSLDTVTVSLNSNLAKNCAKSECHICGTVSLNSSHLEQHMRTHTGNKPYKCDMCDKAYAYQISLYGHRGIHFKKGHLNYISNADVHYKKGHSLKNKELQGETTEPKPDPLPKQFPCSFCDRQYAVYGCLETHERAHCMIKRYLCPGCGVYYLDVEGLQAKRFKIAHVNSCGTLPKSFNRVRLNIPQIRKAFSTTVTFNPLERQVGNPFVFIDCSACCSKLSITGMDDRIDAQYSYLNVDAPSINKKRLRKDRKTYKCSQCGKWFAYAIDLNLHRATHRNQSAKARRHTRSYVSRFSKVKRKIVPTKTSKSVIVAKHRFKKRKAEVMKPRVDQCSYCGKKLRTRSRLIRHLRIHTGRQFKHEALSTYMLHLLDQDSDEQGQYAIHSHSNLSHNSYMPLQQNDIKIIHPVCAGTQPNNYLTQDQFIEHSKPLLEDGLRTEHIDHSYHADPMSIQHGYSGEDRGCDGDVTTQRTLDGQPNQEDGQPYRESNPDHPLQSKGVLDPYPHYK